MAEVVSMNVPEKVVAEIVQAEVVTRVAQALHGNNEIVKNVVAAALTLKVGSDGKPTSYSGGTPYIEYLATEAIRTAAREALQEYISGNKAKIKKDLEKQMAKSSNALVQAFMNSVLHTASRNYLFDVRVNVKENERE